MAKLLGLVKGEILRLWRYKITFFGLLVSGIWLLILALVTKEEANALLPQLLILDGGLMAIILLAAAYYYEKQEGTLKAVLVSPTSPALLLLAKVIGALFGSVISLTLIWLTMVVIHQTSFPILPAFGFVVLLTLAHLSIGYVLIYKSKDFMDLLIKYTGAVLVLFSPIILVSLDVIPASWSWIALLSPTYAGQFGLGHLWQPLSIEDLLLSLLALAIYPLALFPFYILPKFRQEAVSA